MDLEDMEEKELLALQARINALLPLRASGGQSNGDDDAFLLWDALASRARAAGCDVAPWGVARKLPGAGAYSAAARDVGAWLVRYMGPLPRHARAAAIAVCASCLIDWMRARNIPVVTKTLQSLVPRIPGLMDRAFPGYAEAGLLRTIIRRDGTDTKIRRRGVD